MVRIPESTLRHFHGWCAESLADHPRFVAERLFERGDSDDLRWLVSAVGEAALGEVLVRRGGHLSNRDQAFWQLVLDQDPTPLDDHVANLRQATWPL